MKLELPFFFSAHVFRICIPYTRYQIKISLHTITFWAWICSALQNGPARAYPKSPLLTLYTCSRCRRSLLEIASPARVQRVYWCSSHTKNSTWFDLESDTWWKLLRQAVEVPRLIVGTLTLTDWRRSEVRRPTPGNRTLSVVSTVALCLQLQLFVLLSFREVLAWSQLVYWPSPAVLSSSVLCSSSLFVCCLCRYDAERRLADNRCCSRRRCTAHRLIDGVFTRSSRRPANVQQFTCILITFAGSLLDVCWIV